MRDIPKPGQPLRHFKGAEYIYLGTCRHTETGETLALYCSPTSPIYARPLDMFLSEVPEGKENPTGQQYRFEDI